MPVTVKFDNTTWCPQQAQIIPNASPFNDGVMSKEQAAKLAELTPGGITIQDNGVDQPTEPALNFVGDYWGISDNPGASTDVSINEATDETPGLMPAGVLPNVIPIQNSNYDASPGDVIRCDTTLGGFNITLPAVSSSNKGRIISVYIQTPEAANTVTILPTGGDNINLGPSEALDSGTMTFMSDGDDNWMLIY